MLFQGKIRLPTLDPLPIELQELYDGNEILSRSFQNYLREYNAANAFTNLGVHMDDRIVRGRGPSPFVIHEVLHHRIGALLPNQDEDAMYAQLYIYNLRAALDTRYKTNPRLNRNNPFYELYQCAFEVLEAAAGGDENFNVPAYLHYDNSTDHRRYNMPTTDEIAIILPGDGMEISNVRYIIMYRKQEKGLMQISEFHPAYLPLHYFPSFFPTGQLGWTTGLKHWDVTRNVSTSGKLSMKQYFCYRLFECTSEYSPILRGGRLFQQFIVDAWAANEQNRLTYARLKQDEFHSDLYCGLTDIATEGLNADQVE
ncbi:hypothetical protein GIB67_020409 [Kingdonia uniflora]|uniref:Helitron helicase-like domain-containing protein n=1 Tax=Kingdonia uniflora TaxID=39325 RepID=A0A7J7NWH0_9MAGN|nr:hypothetical protein GIB67_020409 [Kingdonia uniflora]